MDENKRFELAEFLKELRDQKHEWENKIKALNEEIESVQGELVADLIASECANFNYKGFNYSLCVKEYPAAEPETKDELYRAMREHGFEDLFTINSQTLSATVRDLKANNDGELPAWLEGLIKIAEKTTIQIRKGRKV